MVHDRPVDVHALAYPFADDLLLSRVVVIAFARDQKCLQGLIRSVRERESDENQRKNE